MTGIAQFLISKYRKPYTYFLCHHKALDILGNLNLGKRVSRGCDSQRFDAGGFGGGGGGFGGIGGGRGGGGFGGDSHDEADLMNSEAVPHANRGQQSLCCVQGALSEFHALLYCSTPCSCSFVARKIHTSSGGYLTAQILFVSKIIPTTLHGCKLQATTEELYSTCA